MGLITLGGFTREVDWKAHSRRGGGKGRKNTISKTKGLAPAINLGGR